MPGAHKESTGREVLPVLSIATAPLANGEQSYELVWTSPFGLFWPKPTCPAPPKLRKGETFVPTVRAQHDGRSVSHLRARATFSAQARFVQHKILQKAKSQQTS